MNKDLFEYKIGEALRESKATPPVDAWDFIKTRIPSASPAPPFKFPTWAVAVVSSAMLGTMAIVGGPSEKAMITADNEIVKPIELAQVEGANVVQSQPNKSEAAMVVNELVQGVEGEIGSNAVVEEHSSIAEQSNTEEVVLEIPAEDYPTEVLVESPVYTQEPLSNVETETTEEPVLSSNPETIKGGDVEATAPKEFAISGTQECYAPCNIKLLAQGNAEEYSWDAGIDGVYDGKELNLVINEAKSLSIFGTAKYADGSEKAITHNVVVKPGSQLFVPNSFTPNGDGVNDEYQVSGSGIDEFSMTIINSKGKVVHQTTDMANAWRIDGISMDLDTEVYTAIIRARGIDGKEYSENVRLIINP